VPTARVWSSACGLLAHRRWVVRADGPASCSYPQCVPRRLVCCTSCLGRVLHAHSRKPPQRLCVCQSVYNRPLSVCISLLTPQRFHPSALKRLRVCQRWQPSHGNRPRRLHQSAPCHRQAQPSSLRLAIAQRSHQSFRLAPWAACAFAALRGARGGQLAAGGLPGGLVGAGATRGGTRWCRVGDRVGARRRWKRPLDFPILSAPRSRSRRQCSQSVKPCAGCIWRRNSSPGTHQMPSMRKRSVPRYNRIGSHSG
jgi:hypothetical protein